jgi:TonB family protein
VQNAISDLAREVGSSEQAGEDSEWNSLVSGINADLGRRAYGKRAQDVYSRSWMPPASLAQENRLRVRVVVRIAQDGKVIDYQIFSKSGNAELDRSVARLLDTVQQLPAPPWTEGSGWYSLGIEFRPYAEE